MGSNMGGAHEEGNVGDGGLGWIVDAQLGGD